MSKWSQIWSRQLIIPVVLVLLGIFLRSWQYWSLPVIGETQDEAAWTMLGASLLQTGQPASWSFFAGYQTYAVLESDGAKFRVVRPVLDHPPLFSLLPGAVQTIMGHPWLSIPSIKLARFPLIVLGALNLILFAVWLYRLPTKMIGNFGRAAALLVWATAPSFVLLSRLVVSENLIVTGTLGLLLATTIKSARGRWLQWVILLLLPLTKISGLALAAGEVVANWLIQPTRRWSVIIVAAAGLGLLLLYAGLIDFNLFWQIQVQQAQRDTGLLTLFSSQLWQPTLVQKQFADVWITLGYLATFGWLLLSAKEDKHERQLAILFIAQLSFMVLSVGELTVHGWYRIVLLPFFAYSLGWLAERVNREQNWLGLALAWLLMMPVVRLGWLSWDNQSLFAHQAVAGKVILLLAGVSLAGMTFPLIWRRRLWQGLGLVLVLAVLSSNILTILCLRDTTLWQDALYLEQGIRP